MASSHYEPSANALFWCTKAPYVDSTYTNYTFFLVYEILPSFTSICIFAISHCDVQIQLTRSKTIIQMIVCIIKIVFVQKHIHFTTGSKTVKMVAHVCIKSYFDLRDAFLTIPCPLMDCNHAIHQDINLQWL